MTIPVHLRRPNTTLRALRMSLHMSQTDFARAIRQAGEALGQRNDCTKRLVQKWESGEHNGCRPHYRRALERVTRCPYAQLGFADSESSLGMAVLPVAAQSFAAGASPVPSRLSSTSAARPDDTSERFRYALEQPGKADPETVGLLESATARLFNLEHHERASNLLPVVKRHLEQTAVLLAGTERRALRLRLTLVGGQTAALAGLLAFEQGDVPTAQRYWDTALAAAQKAGNGPLLAYVLTCQSAAAAERGDPMAAWQLAHTAVSHVGKQDRARAWMGGRAAQEAAELGEVGAALAELERILKIAENLRPVMPGDDTPPWVRFVDSAYLYAMVANVYGRLVMRRDAYQVALRAGKTLGDGKTKARALVLAEVAYAAAGVGDTKQAMQYAAEAVELAEVVEATQAMRRLRAMVHLLPKPLGMEGRRLAGRVTPE